MDVNEIWKAQALERAKAKSILPWQPYYEDRYAAEEELRGVYTKALGLRNPPRFAWAKSPYGVYLASRYLRALQSHGSQDAMKSIIPLHGNVIDYEARLTFMESLIDKDLAVQSGQNLRRMMIDNYLGKSHGEPVPVADLSDCLHFTDRNANTSAPPRFTEQVIFPALYGTSLYMTSQQAIVIMPFVKVCFLSLPPTATFIDEWGHLHRPKAEGPAMIFADGFDVWADRSDDEEKLPEKLPVSTETKQLTDGEDDR